MGEGKGRENLRPLEAGTDRARAIASMGGRACAQARRRAKAVAELTDAALSSPLKGKPAATVRAMFEGKGDEDVTRRTRRG